jgi:formylglycine-generating enzyme required for sulfatase activity
MPPPQIQLKALEGSPGQVWLDPVTGMSFAWVPGGTYEMGSGSWMYIRNVAEQPVHNVRLNGFWLGKFEVTQDQWKKVMGSNSSKFQKGDNYPVEMISWDDAQEFISKLNKMGNVKFRLPTEAEWEYAARSGGKRENFSGGEDRARMSWNYANSGATTHEVGSKGPNGLGIYDMSGNVGEWCEDVFVYKNYSSTPQDNPVVSDGGNDRVTRGGSWYSGPMDIRTTSRKGYSRDTRIETIGFRLVRIP